MFMYLLLYKKIDSDVIKTVDFSFYFYIKINYKMVIYK